MQVGIIFRIVSVGHYLATQASNNIEFRVNFVGMRVDDF